MPIRVTTDGLGLLYRFEFGLSRFNDSLSTWSVGMKAIAKVVR